jgi:hypothetical protein
MKRFLPFLLALLVVDLAGAEGTNEKQVPGVELAQPDLVTNMDFAVVSVRCEPLLLWYGMFYEPPIRWEISDIPPSIPTNSILKIGKEVRGFRLIAVDEKQETRVIQGNEVKTDVTELTIQSGDRQFKMRKGERLPYTEKFATFRGNSPQPDVTVRVGDSFKMMGRSFLLTDFNEKTGRCTVLEEATNRILDVKPIAHFGMMIKAKALCDENKVPAFRFYLVNTTLIESLYGSGTNIRDFFVLGSGWETNRMYWDKGLGILIRAGNNQELDFFEKRLSMPSIYIASISIALLQ